MTSYRADADRSFKEKGQCYHRISDRSDDAVDQLLTCHGQDKADGPGARRHAAGILLHGVAKPCRWASSSLLEQVRKLRLNDYLTAIWASTPRIKLERSPLTM